MTISTIFYFFENINDHEIAQLFDINEDILSEFYIDPPEELVQETIKAVINLSK